MKMSLTFGPDGAFELDGRSLAVDQLETELSKLPRGTSIEVTFARGSDNRRSTFRQVAKWIYAAGLNVFALDVSKVIDESPSKKRPDG
jgi:hypothetical protein